MEPTMNFGDLPTFTPKKRKLIASILFLIEEAAKVGRDLSKGEIVKSLFVADDKHLEQHGRPITFDNYVAMKNGPVGNLTSDLLNDNRIDWSDYELDRAPWTTRTDENDYIYYGLASIPSNRRTLSPSDVDALSSALTHVMAAGFGQISRETHTHPSWLLAWSARGKEAKRAAMDWRDFPKVDPDAVFDLVMVSWTAS